MKPHRGALVLTLGILGFVAACAPLGIVAWVMANADLREMDEGRMDPEGRGLTQAGKICGMVATLLLIAVVLAFMFFTVLAMVLSSR